ncbi:MAG: DoxX family protein [Verrucomicrobiaceae bacterium]|nr:DoxX family protein [Verrucomicrobiaceae bacterium]
MISHCWTLPNAILAKAAAFLRDPFLLGIRLYWGWQFFMTGKGKLMNLDNTTSFFMDLGIPLPKLNALMAGSTECFGGLLLLIGLASRLTSIPLIFTMIVAYLTADRDKVLGIFEDSDAFVTAAPFLFMLAAVIIFIFGPGRFSADARLRLTHVS